MTDRLHGLVVTLARDTRTDDAEATIAAIQQLKNVISVEGVVADINTHLCRERVKSEMMHKLYDLFSKD